LNSPASLGMRRPTSKPIHWLLWLLIFFFLVVFVRDGVGGVVSLYHCAHSSRELPTSISELFRVSITQAPGIAGEHAGVARAQARCFDALLQVMVAAVSFVSLVAVIRYLNVGGYAGRSRTESQQAGS
jgi:hypothetical protein